MKTLTWLHISDLHLCPKFTGWDENYILDKLLEDIKRQKKDKGISPDIIFITGDVIYGARKECGLIELQYESAILFLSELIDKCNIKKENIFIVPGNHDVNINNILESNVEWLEKQNTDQIHSLLQTNEKQWHSISNSLNSYREFLKNEILQLEHLICNPSHLIYGEKRSINGLEVGIAGLNTAWASRGKGETEKSTLHIGGEWQIKTLLPNLKNCDIKIGLSHHPCEWAHPSESHRFSQTLQANLHFHLHGHEHMGWIEASENSKHYRIAAGALYVRQNKVSQSGYNIVHLDFNKCKGMVYFRGFEEVGGGGWVTKEIPNITNSLGEKTINLIELIPHLNHPEKQSQEMVEGKTSSGPESRGIYGRNKLINQISSYLEKEKILLIVGLRGIGKTIVINEVTEYHFNKTWKKHQFNIESGWDINEIYLQIASALDLSDEYPTPPPYLFGKCDWNPFLSLAKKAKPILIKIGRVEQIIKNGRFKSDIITNFISALNSLTNVRIILESRKSLDQNNFTESDIFTIVKVKGFDAKAIQSFFYKPKPVLQPSLSWKITTEESKIIFARFGGAIAHNSLAHTFGIRLLAILSEETGKSPISILTEKNSTLYDKLEEELFRDIYENALNSSCKKLFKLVIFYRDEIPDEHVAYLNHIVNDQQAFDELLRMFLINSSQREDYHFVHDLFRELAKKYIDENSIEDIHHKIAKNWIKNSLRSSRPSSPNRRAATEALFHTLQSGYYELLTSLPSKLIPKGNLIKMAKNISFELFKEENNIERLPILQFLVSYNPYDHKSHRYLAEAIEKVKGFGHYEALEHHLKAYQLDSEFPPYLSNLGTFWIRSKEPHKFINLLNSKGDSKGINHRILAIKAKCLEAMNDFEGASMLRTSKIEEKSKHAVFYHDEATYLISKYKRTKDKKFISLALDILEIAHKIGITRDHTLSIKANCMELNGDYQEASKLRKVLIRSKSPNVAIYNAEAKYLLKRFRETKNQKYVAEAFEIITKKIPKKLKQNPYVLSAKAECLNSMNDFEGASQLRREQIKRGSKTGIFYVDEAKFLLKQYHSFKEKKFLLDALDILEQAKINNASTDYTLSIKATCLSLSNQPEKASEIRNEQIKKRSKNLAFYADEARYLLEQFKGTKDNLIISKAFRILEDAENINSNIEYILSIKAKCFEAIDDFESASLLRQTQIKRGSKTPTFYNDEVLYLLSKYKDEKDCTIIHNALKILKKAEENNANDNYSASLLAKCHEFLGNFVTASDIRMKFISKNSDQVLFYNDEANCLISEYEKMKNMQLLNRAMEIVEKAERKKIADNYTFTIKTKIIRKAKSLNLN